MTHHRQPGGMVPVTFQELTIYVTPDYYTENGIRIPVDLQEAHQLAEDHSAILPTPEMVDAIWQAADIRLSPVPLNPDNTGDSRFYHNISDPKWITVHNSIIEEQLRNYNDQTGTLIAGHKKDIVQHPKNSSRIAIYGWHRTNGDPIQPLSTVHSWDYKDYSQGLRLVSKTAYDADGNPITLDY